MMTFVCAIKCDHSSGFWCDLWVCAIYDVDKVDDYHTGHGSDDGDSVCACVSVHASEAFHTALSLIVFLRSFKLRSRFGATCGKLTCASQPLSSFVRLPSASLQHGCEAAEQAGSNGVETDVGSILP